MVNIITPHPMRDGLWPINSLDNWSATAQLATGGREGLRLSYCNTGRS